MNGMIVKTDNGIVVTIKSAIWFNPIKQTESVAIGMVCAEDAEGALYGFIGFALSGDEMKDAKEIVEKGDTMRPDVYFAACGAPMPRNGKHRAFPLGAPVILSPIIPLITDRGM